MTDDKKRQPMGPGLPTLLGQDEIPPVVPILPLRNSVFFPGGVLPLAVGRQKTISAGRTRCGGPSTRGNRSTPAFRGSRRS